MHATVSDELKQKIGPTAGCESRVQLAKAKALGMGMRMRMKIGRCCASCHATLLAL